MGHFPAARLGHKSGDGALFGQRPNYICVHATGEGECDTEEAAPKKMVHGLEVARCHGITNPCSSESSGGVDRRRRGLETVDAVSVVPAAKPVVILHHPG